MMKNLARMVRVYSVTAFMILFIGCATGLFKNRAAAYDYMNCAAFFVVALASLEGGTIVGLLVTLIAVFAHASFLMIEAFLSGAIFVFTFESAWWLIMFLAASFGVGFVGDRLRAIDRIFTDYSTEIGDLVSTGSLSRFSTPTRFLQDLQYEVSRAKRGKSVFVLLYIELVDLSDITMRFGRDGLARVMAGVGSVILHLTRDTDKKARVDNNTYGILLPETPPENLPVVIRKLESELKSIKVEIKGQVAKYSPMVVFGYSSFPKDGDNDVALVNKARESMPKTEEGKCDFIEKP